MLVLGGVPALAHTTEDIDEWITAWIDRALDEGVTLEAVAEYVDMAERHPAFFGRPVPVRAAKPTRSSSPPPSIRTAPAGVEQWRPLVMSYFSGADVDIAMRIISCESKGNPNAKNRTSSAAGLWQFLRDTWNRVAAVTGSPTYAQGGPYDPVWATINAHTLRHWPGSSGWGQWKCY